MFGSGRICIIDPASHIPSLKHLFPEAEYYSHNPDRFFRYTPTHHYSQEQLFRETSIMFRTDWDTITSDRYDILLLVAPVLDYYDGLNITFTLHLRGMRDKIKNIINTNHFKMVALFDIYDYDYDPNTINTEWSVDIYFKRNYRRTQKYLSNVYPFPYIMFVKPCVLGMCLTPCIRIEPYRVNKAFWCGGLYDHIDMKHNAKSYRKSIYRQISHLIDTIPHCEYNIYLSHLKKYKIGVDLIGVGDPNKRTIELLTHGVLMMTMCVDLVWGFDADDRFHPDTFFSTAGEFNEKLHRLLTDESHYIVCLTQQNAIVRKYFNRSWLHKYICERL